MAIPSAHARRGGIGLSPVEGDYASPPSYSRRPRLHLSYHKKVTSVAKEQRGMRGFSFRESAVPEAGFPRRTLLGNSLNKLAYAPLPMGAPPFCAKNQHSHTIELEPRSYPRAPMLYRGV